ncbi:MAG: CDP-diacylglycerol--serine O-phosphatidyltransferase [Myxococcales bacterium]|nr:CDP-diacylglycerol--serine O-phosphatidyltransferase [Myxococcales bacterium]|tara:strand:- start:411 stop:1166 length:756 start_codon:yes stop_codon:yes gene_type:complete
MKAIKYLVPNSFTALSLVFGLASIAVSTRGDFELASWLILWGVLLDKLDGASARLLNASSEFGVQFDSFADFVVFGIAPAALVYSRLSLLPDYSSGAGHTALIIVSGGYVLATAGRLARFNIAEPVGGDQYFFGIPTTMTGAIIASAYLTLGLFGLEDQFISYAIVVLFILALSMVSNIRLPKLKARNNVFVQWFQIINIGAVYATTPFKLWPHYLLGLALLYLAIGIVWALMNPIEQDRATALEKMVEEA